MTIINNAGKQIKVNSRIYESLKNEFLNGTWMCIIDINGNTHSIILPDNF